MSHDALLHTSPAERMALIKERLDLALAPLSLDVQDDSAQHTGHPGAASGGHYTVTIVSAIFIGKARVARHRLVYDALADAMQRGIHALAIVAYTPEEFDARFH